MAAPKRGFPTAVIGSLLESKYLCSQCRRILRNPVQSFCGHRFCRACVEGLLRGGENVVCPSCVQEQHEDEELLLEQVYPDNATKRELYALPAICPNEGCTWHGTLKEFEKHEGVCEFRKEECQCGEYFRPEDFQAHLTTACPFRLVNCPHCDTKTQFRQQQAHFQECLQFPVQCTRCGEENIIRKNLPAHMATEGCKLRIRCPYGCGVMVEEALLDDHLRESVRQHLDVVGNSMDQLTARVDSGFREMQAAVQLLNNVTGAGSKEEEEMETGETGDLQGQLNAVERKVDMSEQFSIVLKREIEKVGRTVETMRLERAEDRDRLEALETKLEQMLSGGGAVAPSSAAKQEVPLSTDGTLVWKITNFRQKIKDAVSRERMVLTSQPFYTSPTGYKLCARVYPNGDGVGKDHYLSLFLVIMRGPYDALLKWPFRQKVSMALHDQGPRENHIVDSFRPDPGSNSFQRPVNEINTASGCPMFASHDVILQEGEFQYLKDGSIFIKITIDTTGL